MDKIVELVVAVVGVAAAFILILLIGPLIGAFSGWVVGWFFSGTILGVLESFGVETNFSLWQLGMTLGWVGAFFKAVQNAR